MNRALRLWVASACFCSVANHASANPEPTAYDTRSVGMGLVGVSFIDTPAAVAINPALLDKIEKGAVSLFLNPFFARNKAPVSGPNTSVKSDRAFAPLGSVFVAGRIAPRVVFGGGFYLEVAYGSSFSNVDDVDGEADRSDFLLDAQDMEVFVVIGEVALGPSFRITDKLSIGMTARIPFAVMQASLPANILAALGGGGLAYERVKFGISGVGRPTARFGVAYDPTDRVSLGVMYRMNAKIPMTGFAQSEFLTGNPKLDATSEWRVSHALQAGISFRLLANKRLLLALESRIQFHAAPRSGSEEISVDNDFSPTIIPLGWKNVYNGKIGVEYQLSDLIALRAGSSLANSATPKEFAQYFTIPPGPQASGMLGIGFKWENYRLDIAGSIAWNAGRVRNSDAFETDDQGNVLLDDDGEPIGREVEIAGRTERICSSQQVIRSGCPGIYSVMAYWASMTFTHEW